MKKIIKMILKRNYNIKILLYNNYIKNIFIYNIFNIYIPHNIKNKQIIYII
jgi:hypothetical protein